MNEAILHFQKTDFDCCYIVSKGNDRALNLRWYKLYC